MSTIPGTTKQWSQLNKGDLLGTLFATRNIDLNTPGILKLSQRSRYVGRTADTGNFIDIGAIVYGNFNSTYWQYWVVSSKIYVMNGNLTGFDVDALANSPTTTPGSDGCSWNGSLYVTKNARVSRLTAGTWTTDFSGTDFTTTTANYIHPIEPNVTNVNLLVGDKNLLKTVAADGTVATGLTLPSDLVIVWIRRGTNANYIGLDSINGGEGAVAVWDGLATTLEANSLVRIKARTPLAGCVDEEGVLNIILSDGRLMRFNGSGFSYEAELPAFRDYLSRSNWGGSLSIRRRVFPRGMQLIRGKIHISIDAVSDTAPYITPNFQSGIWVYDKDNKAFYHKYSLSYANTVVDFGATQGSAMMSAISPVFEDARPNTELEPSQAVGGVLIAGSRLVAGDGTTIYRCIDSITTGENRGQFTTCRIETSAITDTNISIWCKYQGLTTATDKIIFKYRTSYRNPIRFTDITWTSTTTFTTTTAGFSAAQVGDEIQILTGNGAGGTAHITNISLVSTTYTVTIDEAITGIATNNASWIILDNWKKLPTTITYLDTDGYKQLTFPKQANTTWIQIKGELRGEGGVVGIQELQVVSKEHQNAV